ncbi:DNA internalization-related competence protein ComEC/Rec2 [Paenisporosarcina sp. NPDC076898]|uniref:DNA internalization-related competence protein ComEC/Rec2 n=1 Tax=unclassified Paenisporosarcina TaxID=2642018 RepID=UPI003D00DAEC
MSIKPDEIAHEDIFTWTSTYTINGSKLRGFAVNQHKEKWYLTYSFESEKEKVSFLNQSLTGAAFLMKGQETELPLPAHEYGFDMHTYLISHGAEGMLSIISMKQVSQPEGVAGWIAQQRFQMEKHIELHFPLSLQAETKALLLGSRDDVDPQQSRAYQILGITHLFAISGLHVAFLTFIFYQSLLRLSIRKEVAVWCLLICLPVYASLVGGAPSVWRAVGVVEILLLSRQFHMRLAIQDAFAISLLLYIYLQPGVLLQVGFQLSYVAAAVLLFSSPFIQVQSTVFKQSFWITFLCQIGVAPILLYHFYEISLSSFVVNLLFVPLFSVIILPINLVLFLFTFILPSLADFLFILYEPLRMALTTFILKLASLPHQLWNPGKLSNWQMVLAFTGVFGTFFVLELQYSFKRLALTLGLPVIIIQGSLYFDSAIEVTFLNVGQGDATLIELPHRQGTILIDSGGLLRFDQAAWKHSGSPFEMGREVIVPFLKGRGIHTIDTFIWTHADSDHVEGAEEILEEMNVREIHVTPGAIAENSLQQALQTALTKNIPVKEKMAGDGFQIGDSQFTYLSPQDTMYEGNDDSLVLYLKHDLFTALFTGDLEQDGEEDLLKSYAELQFVMLLKAGHHGSNTSSSEAFLDKLQPRLTIFSAGQNNRYGHPSSEVVERFKDFHLPTLTTADVGSIHVRYDKRIMTVQTSYEKSIKKRDLSK